MNMESNTEQIDIASQVTQQPQPEAPPLSGQEQPDISKGNKRKGKEVGTEQTENKRIKSTVWDHFIPPSVSNGVHTTSCKYCGRTYKCHPKINGTSTLKTHSERCKQRPRQVNNDSNQKLLSFKSENGHQGFPKPWSFDQTECRQALATMIILDELPFRFVENNGFKLLMSKCCPMFKIPSRTTVHKDVLCLYSSEKEKLKCSLKNGSPRVSLTTDTWTSNQMINYMCLTAHYIDENWILQKKILNFCPISSHKGEDIGKAVEKCLIEWELDKVMCVTVDNASSNDTAIGYLKRKMQNWPSNILGGRFLHMRCIAHIVNLIVSDGLSMLGNSVEKVRTAVRYIRLSTKRVEKFKLCVESEKLECNASLCLDVPTRWNSTYLMLNSASKLQRAFERYGEDWGESVELPNEEDWAVVKRLITFLVHFYELTNRVSGYHYVTANIHLNAISDTYRVIRDGHMSDDLLLKDISGKMLLKYDKYWGHVEKMNLMIYIPPVFDPRHKLEFVYYVIDRIYEPVIADKLKTSVVDALNDMFKQYKELYNSVCNDSSINGKQTGTVSVNTEQKKSTKDIMAFEFKKHKGNKDGLTKSELDRYLKEEVSDDEDDNFNILDWWKINSPRYPVISKMARDVLAIPISTVSSESAFSTGGRLLDDFRSSMKPATVEALVCCQDWIRTTRRSMTVEEDLQELDKIEEEFIKNGLIKELSPKL